MSPYLNSEVVPLDEVPEEETQDDRETGRPVVLVVDDEPLVADSLSAILNRAGFITVTAYDGYSAMAVARQVTPHLLISDVAMPDMNGIELAMSMVAEIPECKVLLFSGHATSAHLLNAVDAGYDFPLLSKPVHPREMLQQVSLRLDMPVDRSPKPVHLAEVISIRRSA
jgi:DNA-binding NtrC family response regulator